MSINKRQPQKTSEAKFEANVELIPKAQSGKCRMKPFRDTESHTPLRTCD
ncbi:MAG TPA: hypothetical protein PK114_09305 [Smithellaceae bacterium]|nr:hypothetical protein [Smithellaceae bacterium]